MNEIMIETGIELLNAIINNPMEAVVLFLGGYIIYKNFWSARSRMYRKHELVNLYYSFTGFVGNLINNKLNSFCGLNVERLDEVLELISHGQGIHNWNQRDFIKAKTNLSRQEVSQIINALVNQKKIDWDDKCSLVLTVDKND